MIDPKALLGLPGYEITCIEEAAGMLRIYARHTGVVQCPHCEATDLRNRDKRWRELRHDSVGLRRCVLLLETRKWRCKGCGRTFWQRFPGILPHKRATEPYRRSIFQHHWDGISRSRLGAREGIASATVERWFLEFLERLDSEHRGARCPPILGIDEHFFGRRQGYATTFCDLRRHRVYDVVLGRSEAALEAYLEGLQGKEDVLLVCIDLSSSYRALVKKHFPNARIVADRFHVIRLIKHQFLACWREQDPVGSRNRGLLSLMRRHRHNLSPDQWERLQAYWQSRPLLEAMYRFKQRLCYLLLKKHRTRKQCAKLIPRFLRAVDQLRQAGLPQLVTLGETLQSWTGEIARMWRFTRNNGITEGFHNKMEVVQRQAYGFRNFKNYRLRVRVLCW